MYEEKRYGPKRLIDDILKVHENEGIELMIVVYKKKNGRVGLAATSGNNAEILGLVEVGKHFYIDEMFS